MEHGFGGMFMIRMLIVFVFIYVMFIGIALNIAKVYRIKNGVINILEQQQFDMKDGVSYNKVIGNGSDDNSFLRQYLKGIPYTVKSSQIEEHCDSVTNTDEDQINDNTTGVCIVRKGGQYNYYYKVYVYMVIDFPLLGLRNRTIPVSGETITLTANV